MMGLFTKLIASSLGRWALGIGVTMLLSGLAYKWYDFKRDLRDEGVQECVQEINIATVNALELALADERSAVAELRASLDAVAAANQEAIARRTKLEADLRTIEAQIKAQRKTDETYREWADTPLPDGVADRLREAAGSSSGNTD